MPIYTIERPTVSAPPASGAKKYYHKLKKVFRPGTKRSAAGTVSPHVARKQPRGTPGYVSIPMPSPSNSSMTTNSSRSLTNSRVGLQDGKTAVRGCGPCTSANYFDTRVLIGLAIAHVVCGAGLISLQVTSMEEHSALHEIAAGIWCGAVVVITGCIGLLAAKKDRDGTLIMSFRIMSIVCVLFCIGPFLTSTLEMIGTCWPNLLPGIIRKFFPLKCSMAIGLDSSAIFFSVVEIVVAFIAAKVSCFCCIPCLC